MQRVPNGPGYAKGTEWSKICKGYLVVRVMERVPSGPSNAKTTQWSKVHKDYLVLQCKQSVPNGSRYATVLSAPRYAKET